MIKQPFSVCIEFDGDLAPLREGVLAILPDLNVTRDANGIRLSAKHVPGDKLTVSRHGNEAVITYGERVHFFRALSLLAQQSLYT